MIAVLFEVEPHPEGKAAYLEIAAALRPELEKIDGFTSIERFESLSRPGILLSLSYWRDEGAVREWRGIEAHRAAQSRGRSRLFANYRLRVCQVLRDYGMNDREQAPEDLRSAHG
jgi:heme-degrading monooxygenase HmoA